MTVFEKNIKNNPVCIGNCIRQDFPFWVTCPAVNDVGMTSHLRRCDVITSHRRRHDVIKTPCAYWVGNSGMRIETSSGQQKVGGGGVLPLQINCSLRFFWHFQHPDYDASTLESDIALLELSSNADNSGSEVAKIARLADAATDVSILDPSTKCYITGWGYETDDNGKNYTCRILLNFCFWIAGDRYVTSNYTHARPFWILLSVIHVVCVSGLPENIVPSWDIKSVRRYPRDEQIPQYQCSRPFIV